MRCVERESEEEEIASSLESVTHEMFNFEQVNVRDFV